MNKVKEYITTTKGKISILVLILFLLASGFGIYTLSSNNKIKEKTDIAKVDTKKDKENKEKDKDKKEDSSKKGSDEPESDLKDKKDVDTGKEDKTQNKGVSGSNKASSSSNSSSTASTSKKTSSSASSSSGASNTPAKKKVWVVDKPAWTEEIRQPVYVPTWWIRFRGSNERKIYYSEQKWLNDCKFAEGVSQYGDGENVPDPSGKTEVIDTIYHKEEGHWEYR